MRKKLLSLALALCMALSLLPASVRAADSGDWIKKILTVGVTNSFVLTTDGTLYGCGKAGILLGSDVKPNNATSSWHQDLDSVVTPAVIETGVKDVDCFGGYNRRRSGDNRGHILILKENGDLYGRGANDIYQLGLGHDGKAEELTYIMGDVVDMAAGAGFSAAVTSDGTLYVCGSMAQEGLSDYIQYTTPTAVLTGKNIVKVEAGRLHLLALAADGTVYGMGVNWYGQVGTGTKKDLITQPVQVYSDCIDIACGDNNSLALRTNGDLYFWGDDNCLARGLSEQELMALEKSDPDSGYLTAPTRIATNVRSMVGSELNLYYIKKDGSLWSTGSNNDGQRALGWTELYGAAYAYEHTKMADHVKLVGAGGENVIFVNEQNELYGCGHQSWGELGLGDVDYSHSLAYDLVRVYTTLKAPDNTVGGFRDVKKGDYFADAVQWAVGKAITNGTSSTTFSPDQTCTRAQIITFLWRAAGSPEPQGATPFTDVKAGEYYAKATAWAAENGMVSGSTFSPDAPCTREMAVEFMWKQAGSPAASAAAFTDVSSPAVNWAVEQGVTNGTSTTTFSPKDTCTRAQIVTFLYRAFA